MMTQIVPRWDSVACRRKQQPAAPPPHQSSRAPPWSSTGVGKHATRALSMPAGPGTLGTVVDLVMTASGWSGCKQQALQVSACYLHTILYFRGITQGVA
jgi:hypothetical protein